MKINIYLIFVTIQKGSKFYDPSSINEIGKMRDEYKGKRNDEFAGVKSKMRSLTNIDGKENKTGKGVNKHVFKNVRHKESVDVLFNRRVMKQNKNHSK